MLYLDTSIIVSALTDEPDTTRMQTWLDRQRQGELAVSDWVITEFSAALSIKVRTGHTTPPFRARALSAFAELVGNIFVVWPVSRSHFSSAARFAEQYMLGLRAADALHLAVSVDYGATLCTLDRKLAEAGEALGTKVLLV